MTNKEILERLREIARPKDIYEVRKNEHELMALDLRAIADALDPPRPEPGTVVWWRYNSDFPWTIAYVGKLTIECEMHTYPRDTGEWKPARILAPDEVAVKVPPVREWPSGAAKIGTYYYTEETDRRMYQKTIITRAEAQQREREAGR